MALIGAPSETMHQHIPPTLDWLLTAIYPLERPQTKKSTLGKLRAHVSRWMELTDNKPADQIDRAALLAFRKACVDAGQSPSTINSYLRTIVDLASMAGMNLDAKRLKLTERDNPLPTPEIEDLSRVWRITGAAQWPSSKPINAHPVWCSIGPALWWRGVLMLAFCTGLRRSDLFNLTWAEIQDDLIPTVNRKTGKVQHIPIAPPLQPWLRILRRMNMPKVLGASDRQCQIDRELNRLGRSVGLPGLGCQSLRRASAAAYEAAHPGAGKLILNHGKTVTEVSYLGVEKILRIAQPKLIYPESFLLTPSLERQLTLF